MPDNDSGRRTDTYSERTQDTLLSALYNIVSQYRSTFRHVQNHTPNQLFYNMSNISPRQKLKLHISTCPNDTFMFDALLHGRLTPPPSFDTELTMSDIEDLNKSVLTGEPDISKISYAVYPQIADNYVLLDSGSALGYGNGPLLVSRRKIYPDSHTGRSHHGSSASASCLRKQTSHTRVPLLPHSRSGTRR